MKPLFIGFGKQALEYAEVCNFLNIKITSVFVRNIKKNNENLKKFKIKNIYKNLNLALKENKYNCVFIFLPWDKIEKKIIYILKNTNKIVFSEKPLALSLKRLLEIDNFVRKKKKKLFVLYNRRYFNSYQFIKKNLNNDFQITAHIPEKKNYIIKYIDKNLNGFIKFHLTSHWVDFFTSLFNLKIIGFFRERKKFYFKLEGKSKKNFLSLKYNDKGFIKASIRIKNHKYKFNSLEKFYKKNNSSNKFKLLINENKSNQFKPGVLDLIRAIKKGAKIQLPQTKDLKNLYEYLEKLPY